MNSTRSSMKRDPLTGEKEPPQTLNRYVYCLNNPLKYIDPAGTETQVEDPQAAVEKVFQRLMNIDPEAYAEIQQQLDDGTISAIEALVKILELLGFHIESVNYADESVKIQVPEGSGISIITVQIKNNLVDERGQPLYGQFDRTTQTALINFARSGKVTDIAAIICHEVSHSVLGTALDKRTQDSIIYGVEYSYLTFLEGVGVRYSYNYKDLHLNAQAAVQDPSKMYRVLFQKILAQWLENPQARKRR